MTKSRSNATAPNAKGTLVVGSGTDASTTLAVGTNNYVLTADSAEASGVKWAAAAAASFVGCRAYSSTNVTLTNAAYTAITFNNETFDTDGFHDNATNNTRMTIPSGKDGKYRVTFFASLVLSTADKIGVVRIYKNGVGQSITTWQTSIGTEDNSVTISDILDLVATDYLEIYIYQATGSNRLLAGGSNYNWFTVERLG